MFVMPRRQRRFGKYVVHTTSHTHTCTCTFQRCFFLEYSHLKFRDRSEYVSHMIAGSSIGTRCRTGSPGPYLVQRKASAEARRIALGYMRFLVAHARASGSIRRPSSIQKMSGSYSNASFERCEGVRLIGEP